MQKSKRWRLKRKIEVFKQKLSKSQKSKIKKGGSMSWILDCRLCQKMVKTWLWILKIERCNRHYFAISLHARQLIFWKSKTVSFFEIAFDAMKTQIFDAKWSTLIKARLLDAFAMKTQIFDAKWSTLIKARLLDAFAMKTQIFDVQWSTLSNPWFTFLILTQKLHFLAIEAKPFPILRPNLQFLTFNDQSSIAFTLLQWNLQFLTFNDQRLAILDLASWFWRKTSIF